MKQSKYSDGIEKIDGQNYQKVYIKVPADFYVSCPYCGITIECGEDSKLLTCKCGRTFWAEFSQPDIL